MRTIGVILASLVAAGACYSAANAEEVIRLNFDGDPVTDADVYTPGPGDIVDAASIIRSYPWPDGVTQPALLGLSITDEPPAGGFQGGNALRLNTQSAEARKGLFVVLEDPIVGPFTVEGIFYQETTAAADERMEYNILVWLQAWFIADTEARFELRTFGPNTLGLPVDALDFVTSDPDGTESSTTTGPGGNPPIETWHHVAIVYDGDDTVTVWVNDTDDPGEAQVITTHTENWGEPKGLGNLIIGAWANDAGSARDFIGYIDAISISSEALEPEDFALLQDDTAVEDWLLF